MNEALKPTITFIPVEKGTHVKGVHQIVIGNTRMLNDDGVPYQFLRYFTIEKSQFGIGLRGSNPCDGFQLDGAIIFPSVEIAHWVLDALKNDGSGYQVYAVVRTLVLPSAEEE